MRNVLRPTANFPPARPQSEVAENGLDSGHAAIGPAERNTALHGCKYKYLGLLLEDARSHANGMALPKRSQVLHHIGTEHPFPCPEAACGASRPVTTRTAAGIFPIGSRHVSFCATDDSTFAACGKRPPTIRQGHGCGSDQAATGTSPQVSTRLMHHCVRHVCLTCLRSHGKPNLNSPVTNPRPLAWSHVDIAVLSLNCISALFEGSPHEAYDCGRGGPGVRDGT